MLGLVASARSRDQLGRGFTGHSEVQLVLRGLEKRLHLRILGIVVSRQSEDLPHPQIHPALAGPDVADAFQQLVEIVRHARSRRVLQALVVHDEALDQILLQPGGGPLAELRASRGAHPVAHGENGFQVVVFDLAGDLPCAFPANYSEFPNSCPRPQFTLGINAFEVLIYRRNRDLEQLADEGLG